jgi:hypothetical protein
VDEEKLHDDELAQLGSKNKMFTYIFGTGGPKLKEAADTKDLGGIRLEYRTVAAKVNKQAIIAWGFMWLYFKNLHYTKDSLMHQTHILPMMLYPVVTWQPHLKKEIEAFEDVPRMLIKRMFRLLEVLHEKKPGKTGVLPICKVLNIIYIQEFFRLVTGKMLID